MSALSSLLVRKADGSEERFVPEKLIQSLRRAGAGERVISDVIAGVESELRDGMTTGTIYRRAFELLRGHARGIAARYSMKRALLEFGPSGFPFEEFIAAVFRARGERAVTNTFLSGACVEHEIDVLVEGNGGRKIIEAKFHNTLGFKTDLKVALYVAARIEDLQKGRHADELPIEGLLITNTKFTATAIQYGTCAGLALIGWDYPAEDNLHQLIERAGTFPVTALTSLSRREKFALLARDVVLCSSLAGREDILRELGIKPSRTRVVLEEVGSLCMPGKTAPHAPA